MNRNVFLLVSVVALNVFLISQSYALSFINSGSTPQITNGTLGTISVLAKGTGTVEYRKGLFGTWTTSGSFTNLTSGSYMIYARDAVVTKPISISVFVDYNVHIPDANFKAALVGNTAVNTNSDTEIQVSEASAFTGEIDLSLLGIGDLSGFDWFINTTVLHCLNNSLTDLDLSKNLALTYLDCSFNYLTSLDVSANNALTRVRCRGNGLTQLYTNNNITQLFADLNVLTHCDVSLLSNLERLNVSENNLVTLDVTNNSKLTFLDCSNNSLSTLNVKNGQNSMISTFNASDNNLTCITVDDPDSSRENWTEIDPGVAFSLDCADPAPVITDVEVAHINSCNGDSIGSINIISSGGVGAISYSIDGGTTWQGASLFSNLPAGNYFIQIRDGNGYLEKWNLNPVELSQPGILDIIDIDTTYDYESWTGSITVTASGGTPAYLYRLDDGDWQASPFFGSLQIGNYMVYVRDINLCIDSVEVVIAEPIVNIPDAIFKTYLLGMAEINTNSDLEIQVKEAEAFFGIISVNSMDISDLTGIEAFKNISALYCTNNKISRLDLSKNTLLIYLYCNDNALTELDVSNNLVLQRISISSNQIETIGVSKNASLTVLICDNNPMNTLTISENQQLNHLSCENTQLSSLDVSQNILLTRLYCKENSLSSIDVSTNSLLTHFDCSNNQLSSLELTNNAVLQELSCNRNNLTSLDVSGNPQLSWLYCSNNLLTVLDLSNNALLTRLFCSLNDLTNLNVSSCLLLNTLSCSNNLLVSLDVSHNPLLEYLICSFNKLLSIDVSNNELLKEFDCRDNLLTTLDISENPNLLTFYCTNNVLSELNLRNGHNENFCRVYEYYIYGKNNPSLTCVSVDDVEYSNSHWLDCFDLGITFSVNCNPDPLAIDQVVVHDVEGCSGDATGQIVIMASGGMGSLQYSIDNGVSYQTLDTIRNLQGGTYNIVVKDEAGDSVIWASNPVVIDQPESLSYSVSSTHPQCIGSGDGEIRFAEANGGIPPYSYSIDGGMSWDTTDAFLNLYEGDYEVRVRDSNLCVQDYPPNPIQLNDPVHDTIRFVSVQDVEGCFGDSTGIIVINGEVPGPELLKSAQGSLTYNYSIDGGTTWQSSNVFENLPVGEYDAMIAVAGCTYPYYNNPVVVENATDILFTVGTVDPVCHGLDQGEIYFVGVGGGTPSYAYSIDGGTTWAATDTFRTLPAGSYSLYVKDSQGCLKSHFDNPLVLSDPLPFVVSNVDVVNNTRCDGIGNGSITITAGMEAGGLLKSVYATAPKYDFSIDGGTSWVYNDNTFGDLIGGPYQVWARSDKGCLAKWENNPVVVADVNTVQIAELNAYNDDGSSSGRIEGRVTGGEMPYLFRLDEGTWQDTCLFMGLSAGTYLYQVVDQFSCTDSDVISIEDTSIPEQDSIKGVIFESGDTLCFGARQTVVVGGTIEADSVRFEAGSSTRLIAGESIIFLPGVHIREGSYLNASITTDGTFCDGSAFVLPPIIILPPVPDMVPEPETAKSETINKAEEMRSVTPGNAISMKVFPNPNNGSFTIETSGIPRSTGIVVCNTTGSVVYRETVIPGSTTIHLPGVPRGLYFVKTTHTPVPLAQKIIVQ